MLSDIISLYLSLSLVIHGGNIKLNISEGKSGQQRQEKQGWQRVNDEQREMMRNDGKRRTEGR